MTLRERIKLQLRISADDYDVEIDGLIQAAREQLVSSGVSAEYANAAEPSALIERAIATYCKAYFGLDNPESERFVKSFDSLARHLGLSGDYRAGGSV